MIRIANNPMRMRIASSGGQVDAGGGVRARDESVWEGVVDGGFGCFMRRHWLFRPPAILLAPVNSW